MTTVNKYGSMLRELMNNQTTQARKDEIYRKFDEFSDREEKYSAWLRRQDNKINPAFINLPFIPIYSEILATDLAELTITVPTSGYKHLLIIGAGRTNGVGTSSDYLLAQFNGDTGNNYETQRYFANGTSLTAQKNTGQSSLTVGLLSQGGTAAGFVSSFYTIIAHYGTDYDKNVLTTMMVGGIIFGVGGRWDTAEPINSIKMFPGADSIEAGTAISVYGIQ